ETTGARVLAVDRDPAALATAARQFDHPSITWARDDCEQLVTAAAQAPFDAIVSLETIEHLAAPEAFLARCRDLLARGGLLILSTPNGSPLVRPAGTWTYHEHEYTAPELVDLLADAGFGHVELHGQRLSPLGWLRDDIRRELHLLRFNPFVRLGFWVQRVVRGRIIPPALPERADEYEIVPITGSEEGQRVPSEAPFVLIAVARVTGAASPPSGRREAGRQRS
ncbi:MAG TPA: methyltransferase domain-containing protein, partial [Vicinamibacterales bacterium]|nr:methyltransferase domain-containing protein [Vicinamibacterales bacterium]